LYPVSSLYDNTDTEWMKELITWQHCDKLGHYRDSNKQKAHWRLTTHKEWKADG